ncbi:MAG: cytochrome P450 [Acidimicrobiia bacterium]
MTEERQAANYGRDPFPGNPVMAAARASYNPQPAYVAEIEKHNLIHNPDGTVTLLRMADVLKLNRSKATLGNGHHGGGIGAAARRLIPLDLDGAEHLKYRRIIDPLFTPKAIARWEPMIRERANELIDTFVADGEVDVYAKWCELLPSSIFLQMMGIPLTDLEYFLDFKNKQLHPDPTLPLDEMLAEMTAAADRCYAYFEKVIDERTASGDLGDDLIGWCLTAEVDGERLSRNDILDITYLFMIAGLDTVAASLANIINHLATHPDKRKAILADTSRWPAAIEEIMRFESPVTEGSRKTLEDIELGGELHKAGTVFHVSWHSSNLDPEVFPDPLKVDFDRTPNPHIVFASGFHRCLGSHLARMELRVALDEFHKRIPNYRVAVPEAELVYTGNPRTPVELPITWK